MCSYTEGWQAKSGTDPQTGAPAPQPEAATRRAGPGFLERGGEIDAGSLNGRSESEDYPSDYGQGEGEAQHRPVQRGMQSEVVASVGDQPGDGLDAPVRDQQPQQG